MHVVPLSDVSVTLMHSVIWERENKELMDCFLHFVIFIFVCVKSYMNYMAHGCNLASLFLS